MAGIGRLSSAPSPLGSGEEVIELSGRCEGLLKSSSDIDLTGAPLSRLALDFDLDLQLNTAENADNADRFRFGLGCGDAWGSSGRGMFGIATRIFRNISRQAAIISLIVSGRGR